MATIRSSIWSDGHSFNITAAEQRACTLKTVFKHVFLFKLKNIKNVSSSVVSLS